MVRIEVEEINKKFKYIFGLSNFASFHFHDFKKI